jgi:hypothetical protein
MSAFVAINDEIRPHQGILVAHEQRDDCLAIRNEVGGEVDEPLDLVGVSLRRWVMAMPPRLCPTKTTGSCIVDCRPMQST